ncbi:MAG: DNA polymerase III subunit beta [Flavobacterium sp.]|nr:DNA polymerase III subunit beta [Flavobacterium sp.]
MKFIVSSSYLLKQLQVLGSVINSSNTLPILDNFLFELDNNQLKVSASDLETTMTATLEIDSTSQGSVAIPAKLLLDILKTFPEQPLTFTVEDNSTVEISSNSGKYAIAYAPGEEFPKAVVLDDPSKTLVPAEVLATAVSKTIFAAGNDDLRPVMSGVFFQFSPEGLIFVATDAHKLVKYARTDVKASQVADFIMPKKPLNILKGILGASDAEVAIEYNDSNATFSFENYVLTCRLIDGKISKLRSGYSKRKSKQINTNRKTKINLIYGEATILLRQQNCKEFHLR